MITSSAQLYLAAMGKVVDIDHQKTESKYTVEVEGAGGSITKINFYLSLFCRITTPMKLGDYVSIYGHADICVGRTVSWKQFTMVCLENMVLEIRKPVVKIIASEQ